MVLCICRVYHVKSNGILFSHTIGRIGMLYSILELYDYANFINIAQLKNSRNKPAQYIHCAIRQPAKVHAAYTR